jgi:hypothetical protein
MKPASRITVVLINAYLIGTQLKDLSKYILRGKNALLKLIRTPKQFTIDYISIYNQVQGIVPV